MRFHCSAFNQLHFFNMFGLLPNWFGVALWLLLPGTLFCNGICHLKKIDQSISLKCSVILSIFIASNLYCFILGPAVNFLCNASTFVCSMSWEASNLLSRSLKKPLLLPAIFFLVRPGMCPEKYKVMLLILHVFYWRL